MTDNTGPKPNNLREFNGELDRMMLELFSSGKTVEEILIDATATVSRVINVERVSIWSYTAMKKSIRCDCLHEKTHQPSAVGIELTRAQAPSYFEALRNSRIIAAHNAQEDKRTSEFAETYLKPLGIRSMLDAHIPSTSGVRGVLCCESVSEQKTWQAEEESFVASVAQLIGFLWERVEKDKAQLRLQEVLVAAEKAGEAKSAFLANMSHEIRTPMNGVMGMIEMVLAREIDEEHREYLDIALSSARSLMTVLDDILVYSKLEAGAFTITSQPFSVAETVQAVASLFNSDAENKGLILNTILDRKLPIEITGDQARVRQILSNFISNAIKFTDTGYIDISAYLIEGNFVRFEVRDTGIGIPEESAKQLFRRFSQVDSSPTRKYGGTGLGLVISKQLIELMGGSIGVDSELGKGSCFWATLPATESDEQDILAPASLHGNDMSGHSDSRKLKILAAEDDPSNQVLLAALIKHLGHEMTLAENGQVAIDLLKESTFDLVLMDIQMPNMDGPTATRKIRSGETPEPDIPIVALTANAMEGDRESYIAAGMNDYLAKPIEMQQLKELLDDVADKLTSFE